MNVLMGGAAYGEHVVEDLLTFLNTHPTLFGKEEIQTIFLEKDSDNMGVLNTAVQNHPQEIKPLLAFIEKNNTPFNQQELQDIFLQKDGYGGNMLMSATFKHQPEAVKSLLAFIETQSELFGKEIIQKIFLETDPSNANVLLTAVWPNNPVLNDNPVYLSNLSNSQSEELEHLLKFIEKSTTPFDVDTMQQMFIRGHIKWDASIAPILLNKPIADFSMREKENATHRAGFFKPPFPLKEEKEAALTLKNVLESNVSINELLNLKQIYPALGTGKLGLLFDAFYDLVSKGVVFNQVTETPQLR